MLAERIKAWPEKWHQEGRQEGLQEGEERHALQVARRMIEQTALEDDVIAELSGLNLTRVAELRRDAGK